MNAVTILLPASDEATEVSVERDVFATYGEENYVRIVNFHKRVEATPTEARALAAALLAAADAAEAANAASLASVTD